MSVIVISSDSPTFTCQSPATYIDAESIDTSYVYDSEYQSSCDSNDLITISGSGTAGEDGVAGEDGRGIVSVTWTSNSAGGSQGDPGTVDTYIINYTDGTTSTFTVSNGEDGAVGPDGTAATITVGTTTTGAAGTSASVTNSGTTSTAIFDFSIPSGADGSDGATIHTGTTVPDNGLGENGDLYLRTSDYMLYEKVTDAWASIGSIQGAEGAPGDPGTDGQDGDKWTYGTGSPTNDTIREYDSYYLDDSNNNVYYKAEGASTWSPTPITNLNGDKYKTTSATSLDLSTIAAGDPVTITLASSIMSYSTGQYLVVSNNADNRLVGIVTSLSGTTLMLDVIAVTGSILASSWTINLAGVVESEITSRWYTITATAGTGDATTRVYSGPSGWAINTSDVVAHTDLGNNSDDLTIVHGTGYSLAECVVFTTSGVINTKLEGTKAYSTVRENVTHTATEIMALATIAQPLIIYIKLI